MQFHEVQFSDINWPFHNSHGRISATNTAHTPPQMIAGSTSHFPTSHRHGKRNSQLVTFLSLYPTSTVCCIRRQTH